MLNLFYKDLGSSRKYSSYLAMVDTNFVSEAFAYKARKAIAETGEYETEFYRVTEYEEDLKNFKPYEVVCDYDLPEKLTKEAVRKHPEFLSACEELGNAYVAYDSGIRVVLGGYVAHVYFHPKNGSVDGKSVCRTINKKVYADWCDGKLHNYSKYYTYGTTVLSTLDRKPYLNRLHDWESKHGLLPSPKETYIPFDPRDIKADGKVIGQRCIWSGEVRLSE